MATHTEPTMTVKELAALLDRPYSTVQTWARRRGYDVYALTPAQVNIIEAHHKQAPRLNYKNSKQCYYRDTGSTAKCGAANPPRIKVSNLAPTSGATTAQEAAKAPDTAHNGNAAAVAYIKACMTVGAPVDHAVVLHLMTAGESSL